MRKLKKKKLFLKINPEFENQPKFDKNRLLKWGYVCVRKNKNNWKNIEKGSKNIKKTQKIKINNQISDLQNQQNKNNWKNRGWGKNISKYNPPPIVRNMCKFNLKRLFSGSNIHFSKLISQSKAGLLMPPTMPRLYSNEPKSSFKKSKINLLWGWCTNISKYLFAPPPLFFRKCENLT